MRSLKSGMSQHQSDGVSGNGAGGDGDMVHTNYTAEAVQVCLFNLLLFLSLSRGAHR